MAKDRSVIQLVVCDAGPLIHLDELETLDLLGGFQSVLVPDAVWTRSKHIAPVFSNGWPVHLSASGHGTRHRHHLSHSPDSCRYMRAKPKRFGSPKSREPICC